ncbi:MAG TPA: hypothetical protein VIK91_18465 [Nannocystis sp.]
MTLFMFTASTVASAAPSEPQGAGERQAGPQRPAKGEMMPDLTPPAARRDWQTEHRFLQAGTGVSWSLVGLGILGMAIPLGMLSRCNAASDLGGDVDCSPERRVAAITSPILGIMTLAALVPAVLFTRKLVRHKRERPVARLQVAPGGLAVQF